MSDRPLEAALVAAIAKMFPTEMGRRLQQRGSHKKTTVLGSLIATTSSPSVDYLANHARFVARYREVPVPHGTTANEALFGSAMASPDCQ